MLCIVKLTLAGIFTVAVMPTVLGCGKGEGNVKHVSLSQNMCAVELMQ